MLFRWNEYWRRIDSVEVMLDGLWYTAVELPTREVGLNNTKSTCSIKLKEIPPIFNEDKQGSVWLTISTLYRDNLKVCFFTGTIGKQDVDTRSRSVEIRDILWKLETNSWDDCTDNTELKWNNICVNDALVSLAHAAGLNSSMLDLPFPDPAPSSNHLLSHINQAYSGCINVSNQIPQLWQALLDFGGLAAYCLPGTGQIHICLNNTLPIKSPSIKFSNDDSDGECYKIIEFERHTGSFEDIITKVQVTGTTVSMYDAHSTPPTEIKPANLATWVANGVTRGKTKTITYPEIENEAQAKWVAEREGKKLCRAETQWVLTIQLEPGILPGMCIAVKHPYSGVDSFMSLFVISARCEGTTTQLVCSGSPDAWGKFRDEDNGQSVITDPIPALALQPTADFSVLIDAEPIKINNAISTKYFVYCDATGSMATKGTIASYSWAIVGSSPENTLSTTNKTIAVLPTLTGVSVRLVITDSQGLTATVTKSLEGGLIKVIGRVLSVAQAGAGWAVLANYEKGWRFIKRPGSSCLAVPPYNQDGVLYSIWSDRTVCFTTDYSTATVRATGIGGAGSATTAAMWVNEKNKMHILVALDRNLYSSKNAGASWSLVYTATNAIVRLETQYTGNTRYIRLAAGNSVLHSYDDGVKWTAATPNFTGTVTRMASAPWGHLATITGGALATVWDTNEGASLEWSLVPSVPTNLGSITPFLDSPGWVLGGTDTKLYRAFKEGTVWKVYPTTPTAPGAIKDLARDGFIPFIAYGASDVDSFKIINYGASGTTQPLVYNLGSGAGTHIGYGALGKFAVADELSKVQVLLIDRGGVWYLDITGNGQWVRRNPVVNGTTYIPKFVATNPNNSKEWWAVRTVSTSPVSLGAAGTAVPNVFFHTTDNGVTWEAGSITIPVGYANCYTINGGTKAKCKGTRDNRVWIPLKFYGDGSMLYGYCFLIDGITTQKKIRNPVVMGSGESFDAVILADNDDLIIRPNRSWGYCTKSQANDSDTILITEDDSYAYTGAVLGTQLFVSNSYDVGYLADYRIAGTPTRIHTGATPPGSVKTMATTNSRVLFAGGWFAYSKGIYSLTSAGVAAKIYPLAGATVPAPNCSTLGVGTQHKSVIAAIDWGTGGSRLVWSLDDGATWLWKALPATDNLDVEFIEVLD